VLVWKSHGYCGYGVGADGDGGSIRISRDNIGSWRGDSVGGGVARIGTGEAMSGDREGR
jgi:hypothetical protein